MCIYFQTMLALFIDQQANKQIGNCVSDDIQRDVMRCDIGNTCNK